jgi:uncharacterized membrane protein
MHEHYERSEFLSGPGLWLIAVVTALVGLGLVFWLIFRNRSRAGVGSPQTDEPSVSREEIGDNSVSPEKTEEKSGSPEKSGNKAFSAQESEILDMLWQKAAPMSQAEIAECLGVEPGEVARALQSLEAQGQVERRWDAEKKAFEVMPL